MRNPTPLDAMRARLKPARPSTTTRLSQLCMPLDRDSRAKVLDEEDLIDAVLRQCEEKKLPVCVEDLAAIFVMRHPQAACDMCLLLITTLSKPGAMLDLLLPYELEQVLRRGRAQLGVT